MCANTSRTRGYTHLSEGQLHVHGMFTYTVIQRKQLTPYFHLRISGSMIFKEVEGFKVKGKWEI